MKLWAASRAHLAEVDEAYFDHLRFAVGIGAMMVAAGLACMLHALVPAVCRNTASRTIAHLGRVVSDRSTLGAALFETAEAVAFVLLLSMAVGLAALFWLLGTEALVAVPIALLALAFPAAVLATNPDLEAAEGVRPLA